MEAMDQTATQSGAEPASRDVWLVQADGESSGCCAMLEPGRACRRNTQVCGLLTEREMVLAIEMYQRRLQGRWSKQVKSSFPQADVIKIPNNNLEDEIPF
jgi:hypothetical protein